MPSVRNVNVPEVGLVTLVIYPDKAIIQVSESEEYVITNFVNHDDLDDKINKKLDELIAAAEIRKLNEDHEIYKRYIQWKGRE